MRSGYTIAPGSSNKLKYYAFAEHLLHFSDLCLLTIVFSLIFFQHVLIAQHPDFEVIGNDQKVTLFLGTELTNGASEIVLGENGDQSVFMKIGYDGSSFSGDIFYVEGLVLGDRFFTIHRINGLATFYKDVKLEALKGSSTAPLLINEDGQLVNGETLDKYWSINGRGFTSNEGYVHNFTNGSVQGAVGTNTMLYAPVHLPDGVNIQEVCIKVQDFTTTRDISIRLKKFSYLNQEIDFLTDDLITSGNSLGWREWCETVTVEDQLVDNQNFSYSIDVEPFGTWSNAIEVGTVRIRYR